MRISVRKIKAWWADLAYRKTRRLKTALSANRWRTRRQNWRLPFWFPQAHPEWRRWTISGTSYNARRRALLFGGKEETTLFLKILWGRHSPATAKSRRRWRQMPLSMIKKKARGGSVYETVRRIALYANDALDGALVKWIISEVQSICALMARGNR